MSLAERLGKMGIPGFRSGKKWKMVIATFGYLFIILMLLPTPHNTDTQSASTNIQSTGTNIQSADTNTKQTDTTGVPTSKPTKSIVITYSDRTTDSLGDFSKPKAGNTFLVVTMTIKNNGYDKFGTNQLYFSVVTNNVKRDSSFDSGMLTDKLDLVDLLDGGSTTGSLAFEVPTGTTDYKLQYKSFDDYNIIYNKE